MTKCNRLITQLGTLLICSVFATGSVVAQEEREDDTKTKQAQAVSKEFFFFF